jgi:hypothetical protein
MRLAASLTALTLLALPAQASDNKDFRDWWAACDNLRNCSGYGFDSELTGGSYLRIERNGAPGAKARAAIAVFAEDGVKFRLAFDDPALPGLPGDVQTGEELDASDMRRVVLAEGGNDSALIDSLRKAKEIVVTRVDPPGRKSDTPVSKISLNGAVAALLWIDEQQKRVGSTTALIRRGDKPESAVPPQPKAPVIVAAKGLSGTAADRKPSERDQAAIKKISTTKCGDGDEGELEDASALSADTFLYPIRCPDSSGAYNFGYTFLIAKTGQPQSARTPKFRWPAKIGGRQQQDGSEDFLTNPDFSNVDMTMRSFSKGRGIGDCGDEERWVFDGKTFQLADMKSMPHCRGVPSEDWPTLYRADVKRSTP